jgi:hypothetical protein
MKDLKVQFKTVDGIVKRLDGDGVWRSVDWMHDEEGWWLASVQDEKLF